jgi:hypothetical protein
MAPLCGKSLSPADRKVWQQAIAILVGLKKRNGFGETDLVAAVGTALRRGATKCKDGVVGKRCEHCQPPHALLSQS